MMSIDENLYCSFLILQPAEKRAMTLAGVSRPSGNQQGRVDSVDAAVRLINAAELLLDVNRRPDRESEAGHWPRECRVEHPGVVRAINFELIKTLAHHHGVAALERLDALQHACVTLAYL